MKSKEHTTRIREGEMRTLSDILKFLRELLPEAGEVESGKALIEREFIVDDYGECIRYRFWNGEGKLFEICEGQELYGDEWFGFWSCNEIVGEERMPEKWTDYASLYKQIARPFALIRYRAMSKRRDDSAARGQESH